MYIVSMVVTRNNTNIHIVLVIYVSVRKMASVHLSQTVAGTLDSSSVEIGGGS